jgi:hypothetical protein
MRGAPDSGLVQVLIGKSERAEGSPPFLEGIIALLGGWLKSANTRRWHVLNQIQKAGIAIIG